MEQKVILISRYLHCVDGIDNLYKKLTIHSYADMPVNIQNAIRKACTDYIGTEAGHLLYERQNHRFNYTDFVLSVPNTINQKYGFQVAHFSFERIETTFDCVPVSWEDDLILDTQILTYEAWKRIKEMILDVRNLHRREQITQLCQESELPLPEHFCDTAECEELLDEIRNRLHPSRLLVFAQELEG